MQLCPCFMKVDPILHFTLFPHLDHSVLGLFLCAINFTHATMLLDVKFVSFKTYFVVIGEKLYVENEQLLSQHVKSPGFMTLHPAEPLSDLLSQL